MHEFGKPHGSPDATGKGKKPFTYIINTPTTQENLPFQPKREKYKLIEFDKDLRKILKNIEAPKAAKQKVKEQIKTEMAKGTNPWLAHIQHNERNQSNPQMVGFYQDAQGEIKTIYGTREFRSKRQIENTIFGGRTEHKEVNLITGEFQQVHPTTILKGEHWNALPEDLRLSFEAGAILITGNQDLYKSDANDPNMGRETNGNNKYYLLYYSDQGNDETGRTGVVLHEEEGEIKPVIVTLGDKEFVIEVKGCGKKSGGFGKMQFRTGRNILTGGAEAEQAENEFNRLQDDKRPDAPKTAGSMLFTNPNHEDYQQGYIIRFTPSTIRASYVGNEAYPDIEEPHMVTKILDMYTSQLTSHIFSDPPKILDRSSHTENMLIWNDGEFAWTDFSDHKQFADKNFPRTENSGGYITPKRMLEYYISMVDEIPGYQTGRDKKTFTANLNKTFSAQGIDLHIEKGDTDETIVQKIWEGGMAYQVFKGRQQGNYIAEGVIKEFYEELPLTTRYLHLESEESFIETAEIRKKDMSMVIDLFQKKLNEKIAPEIINKWRKIVKDGSLSQIIHEIDTIYKVYHKNYDVFTEEEKSNLSRAMGYFNGFDYRVVGKFQEYFEHELDIISAAKPSNQTTTIKELEQAEKEVKGKKQGFFHLMDTDLGGFYRLIKDPEQMKRFIGMSFYGH